MKNILQIFRLKTITVDCSLIPQVTVEMVIRPISLGFKVLCSFVLRYNVPDNNVSFLLGRTHLFLGIDQYSEALMFLAQGNTTVPPMGIEPRTSGFDSDVLLQRHRTINPPCFLCIVNYSATFRRSSYNVRSNKTAECIIQ